MLKKCIVNFRGGGGVLKCGEMTWGSGGCNLSNVPN